MLRWYCIIFILVTGVAFSQDKIFYTNGVSKNVSVKEINPENIIIETDSTTETILKEDVMLIEYKNGSIDVFNSPKDSKIINLNSLQKNNMHLQSKIAFNYNFISFNSLALGNADASVFYEHISKNKKIGLGVMGAYNFNSYSNNPNLFITILNNAKKNYDFGIYCNFYRKTFSKKTTFCYGILFKQTNFSFNLLTEDTVKTSNSTYINVNYKYTKGNQFATIFNIGTHTTILPNFFIKTLIGVGVFKLRGDYKTEFNYEINKNNNSNNSNNKSAEKLNVNFLPKLYMGLNIGFAF